MRRNLIRYLPDILKRSLDFRILMEVQEEYGLQPLWEAAQAVFDDQFISTADEYGIARFEGILGLKPDEDDTLEDRRKAVLMAWRRLSGVRIEMAGAAIPSRIILALLGIWCSRAMASMSSSETWGRARSSASTASMEG